MCWFFKLRGSCNATETIKKPASSKTSQRFIMVLRNVARCPESGWLSDYVWMILKLYPKLPCFYRWPRVFSACTYFQPQQTRNNRYSSGCEQCATTTGHDQRRTASDTHVHCTQIPQMPLEFSQGQGIIDFLSVRVCQYWASLSILLPIQAQSGTEQKWSPESENNDESPFDKDCS